jgi:hypothetical protein
MKSEVSNQNAETLSDNECRGRNDEERPGYWELVAEKLQRTPESLSVAEENIDRWLAEDHSAPQRLLQWKALVQAARVEGEGFARLLRVLGSSDPESARLRDFDPFAGILTREERRRAKELCGYRH